MWSRCRANYELNYSKKREEKIKQYKIEWKEHFGKMKKIYSQQSSSSK